MTHLRSKSLQRRAQRLGRCLNSPSGRTSSTISETPFAATVMVLYFPLWLTEQYGAGSALFISATAIAALLVVLIAPGLGALADLHQRRIPYLCSSPLLL